MYISPANLLFFDATSTYHNTITSDPSNSSTSSVWSSSSSSFGPSSHYPSCSSSSVSSPSPIPLNTTPTNLPIKTHVFVWFNEVRRVRLGDRVFCGGVGIPS